MGIKTACMPVVQGRDEEILIIYDKFNPKYLIFPHLFTAQQACCFYCRNDFTLIYCCTSYYKTLPAGLGVSKQEKKGKYEQKQMQEFGSCPQDKLF